VSDEGAMPSFFILGAARCGTTTLADSLRQHHEVWISEPKEPNFFCPRPSAAGDVRTLADYSALFPADSRWRARGDASAAYLADPDVPRAIHQLLPGAQFLVILRDPAVRAFSMYSLMRARGYESRRTFEAALAVEDRRLHSARFARGVPDHFWNFMYYRSGLFGEQVQRYYEFFSPGQFFFTTLAELRANSTAVLDRVCEFLGVTAMSLESLPWRNRAAEMRRHRSQAGIVQRARQALRQGSPGHQIARAVRGTVSGGRASVPALTADTYDALSKRYDADLGRLRELTGIEVPREPPGEAPPVGMAAGRQR
jgi:hypothetical protein